MCWKGLSESNDRAFSLSFLIEMFYYFGDMSSTGTGKSKLHTRTVTEKYDVFKKKSTNDEHVVKSHGNMTFQSRRCRNRLMENLRFMMK